MSVKLMTQRDGSWRKHWYGVYEDGKDRRVINLGVPWRGSPPASGSLRDPGDKDFERSREKAEDALARHVEDIRHKGRAEHLTERLIESKTGKAVNYARIDDLPKRWRNLGRETEPSERYLAACDAHLNRFAAFMRKQNADAVHLYEVNAEDAAAFVKGLQTGENRLARKTIRDAVKLLNKCFASFLPVGAENPFTAFMGRHSKGDGETFHRKPFTPEELKAILSAARDDGFMYPLITAAACTGLRRGDICALKWKDVDLAANMLTVKTSKTGASVEIPIFEPLRDVLDECRGNDKDYVFPAAAKMLAENPDGLTWRLKKIIAKAFAENGSPAPGLPAQLGDIEQEGAEAIVKTLPEGDRRNRVLDIFRRYCSGQSFRDITLRTGYGKATVSNDLHAVQKWIGKPFLRVQAPRVKDDIRDATQVKREHGQRAASVRDWHALRATYVTLALTAGVPVELVRRVTGHATVEIVLKHYFHPDREQFRTALTDAMPGILTGNTKTKIKPSAELATLAAKIADGTATDEDKSRLKKLVAKI